MKTDSKNYYANDRCNDSHSMIIQLVADEKIQEQQKAITILRLKTFLKECRQKRFNIDE